MSILLCHCVMEKQVVFQKIEQKLVQTVSKCKRSFLLFLCVTLSRHP